MESSPLPSPPPCPWPLLGFQHALISVFHSFSRRLRAVPRLLVQGHWSSASESPEWSGRKPSTTKEESAAAAAAASGMPLRQPPGPISARSPAYDSAARSCEKFDYDDGDTYGYSGYPGMGAAGSSAGNGAGAVTAVGASHWPSKARREDTGNSSSSNSVDGRGEGVFLEGDTRGEGGVRTGSPSPATIASMRTTVQHRGQEENPSRRRSDDGDSRELQTAETLFRGSGGGGGALVHAVEQSDQLRHVKAYPAPTIGSSFGSYSGSSDAIVPAG